MKTFAVCLSATCTLLGCVRGEDNEDDGELTAFSTFHLSVMDVEPVLFSWGDPKSNPPRSCDGIDGIELGAELTFDIGAQWPEGGVRVLPRLRGFTCTDSNYNIPGYAGATGTAALGDGCSAKWEISLRIKDGAHFFSRREPGDEAPLTLTRALYVPASCSLPVQMPAGSVFSCTDSFGAEATLP